MTNRREFVKRSVLAGAGLSAASYVFPAHANQEKELKAGIIGLDTSHSPAFTKLINDPQNPKMQGVKVAYAYPFGSKRIEASASRIPKYIEDVKALGVQVLDSLEEVVKASDVLLLETNDGTLHVEQFLSIVKSKKPVFIDKPVAAKLSDVIKIYDLAKQNGVPIFSSSSLRYMEGAQKVRYQNAVGKVTGAEAYSPQHIEPMHTDLFWYGIHGVEILYTIMGPGCEQVRRMTGPEQDIVIGKWKDGRIGTYRGDVSGRQFYGGTAYGTERVLSVGPFDGYHALVEVSVQFFKDRKSPVDDQETIELYTFMEAADVSKNRSGEWVNLQEVFALASMEAKK